MRTAAEGKAPPPRLIFLNQVSGPMFRELAEDLSRAAGPGLLYSSDPPTSGDAEKLTVVAAPAYDRRTEPRRLLSWARYFVRALLLALRQPADALLIIVSNPPFLPWVGWILSLLRKQRYVVIVYDVYPGLLENLGRIRRGGSLARAWRFSNRLAWGRASVVSTIGEHMAANVRTMLPVGDGCPPLLVVPNWADGSRIRPVPKAENRFAVEHGLVDQITVLYSGNIGATHDLTPLLDAAQRLRHHRHLGFLIIGSGVRWPMVCAEVARRRLTNVRLLPLQPEETLPLSLAAGDIAVVSLEKGVEGHSVPSKAFYSMAAGSALLVISEPPNELADIIDAHRCGLAVRASDGHGVAVAIVRFLEDREFLERCRHCARAVQEQHYSRSNTRLYEATLRPLLNARQIGQRHSDHTDVPRDRCDG